MTLDTHPPLDARIAPVQFLVERELAGLPIVAGGDKGPLAFQQGDSAGELEIAVITQAESHRCLAAGVDLEHRAATLGLVPMAEQALSATAEQGRPDECLQGEARELGKSGTLA